MKTKKCLLLLICAVFAVVNAQEVEEIEYRPDHKPHPTCYITYHVAPVCGTDGKDYINVSALKCAANENPDLQVKHEGKCSQSFKQRKVPVSNS
ncbi:hypothetical protein CHUAL_007675 [Chamberlinius hualienensis]